MDPTTTIWVAIAGGVIVVIGSILWLKLHACLALLLGALVVGLVAPDPETDATIGGRLAEGFGNTCGTIGILIAMASIIGRCMMDSGAADRVVRTMLTSCGEKRAPLAFLVSGFLLGIPVFFDTVFYLMIPLAKALQIRTQKDYLLYVLSIVAGATMAHSLVPPTPGPLYVAEQLQINLVTMSVAGCIVGFAAALAGYAFAIQVNRRVGLELRDGGPSVERSYEEAINADEARLPPFALAIVPLMLPTILIALGTLPLDQWSMPGALRQTIQTISDKNIALAGSAVVSLWMLWRYGSSTPKVRQKAIEAAVADGGSIILITSAGGAFGEMLKQTGVTTLISELPQASPAAMCAIAFVITTAIRTAQGSATVAMITAVSLFSGIATGGSLGFHPVYLALAIGCGSKPFAWMNDSGFWVITRMSGMTEQEGLKFVTPMSLIMGAVGLGMVLIGVSIMPNF